MNDSQHSHWSSFWSRGHVNTFGQGKENYSGFIEQFWRKFIVELEPGSAILDVASGNGAIALLAEKFSAETGKSFAITACDVARITPQHINSKVSFYGGVDIAHTQFSSAQYQLITSQFGFEYSDKHAALEEIGRLLSSGGKFVAFAHHYQSSLVRTADQICSFLQGPVKADKPLGLARELVRAMGKIESQRDLEQLRGNKNVENLRNRLEGLMAGYRMNHGSALGSSGLLSYIEPLFGEGLFRPVKDKLEFLNNCQQEMKHDLQRQKDLLGAALDEETMVELRAKADSLGLQWLHDEVVRLRTGEILGRALQIKKPGQSPV